MIEKEEAMGGIFGELNRSLENDKAYEQEREREYREREPIADINFTVDNCGLYDAIKAGVSDNITIKAYSGFLYHNRVITLVRYSAEMFLSDDLKGDKTLILEAAKLQIEELEEELREAKEKIDKYIKEHRDM